LFPQLATVRARTTAADNTIFFMKNFCLNSKGKNTLYFFNKMSKTIIYLLIAFLCK
jgi:hypothetical protein